MKFVGIHEYQIDMGCAAGQTPADEHVSVADIGRQDAPDTWSVEAVEDERTAEDDALYSTHAELDEHTSEQQALD